MASEEEVIQESKDIIGSFNEKGEFLISESEGKRLLKKYEALKSRRQQYLRNYKQARAEQYNTKDPNEYKPKIDKKSEQLVQMKLQREHGEDMSPTRQVDKAAALIKKGQEYKERKEKLAKDKESEDKEEQCTFMPKLQAKYNSQALADRNSPEKRKDKVFEELYKKPEKRTDVRSEDVDFEKNKGELTFKPNIQGSLLRAEKYQSSKHVDSGAPETARSSKLNKLDVRGGSPQPLKSARVSTLAAP